MTLKDVDTLVVESMSGPEKLKALLRSKGLTLADFSRRHSLWPPQVSRVVHGHEPNSGVRDALATELGLPRSAIDELIPDQGEAKEVV